MAVDRFAAYFSDRDTPRRTSELTEAQVEVLRYLSHGLSTSDIGCLLSIDRRSVEERLYRAKVKLAAKTTAHAVAIALRHRLIA